MTERIARPRSAESRVSSARAGAWVGFSHQGSVRARFSLCGCVVYCEVPLIFWAFMAGLLFATGYFLHVLAEHRLRGRALADEYDYLFRSP